MDIELFNQAIDLWISELNKFSHDQLLLKPDTNSWSMGQLYMHILNDTNWYINQMNLSIEDTQNCHREMNEEGKALFERSSFEDKKIAGDPILSAQIKQPQSIDSLIKDYTILKDEMNLVWKKMYEASSHGKSEHPGLGYFTGHQWLRFAEMHMRHHLKQKDNIENFLLNL